MLKMESRFMNLLNKIVDFICLNVAAIIFSIPIFTFGAVKTSLFYVIDKILKDEEGEVLKMFVGQFKKDFKMSTKIWIIYLFAGVLFVIDAYFSFILNIGSFGYVLTAMFIVLFVLSTMTAYCSLGLSYRFENTVKNNIKNGFLISIANFPTLFFVAMIEVIPWVLAFIFPISVGGIVILYSFIGISLTSVLEIKIFDKIFKRFI